VPIVSDEWWQEILAAAAPRVPSATGGAEIERALKEYLFGREPIESGKVEVERARQKQIVDLASKLKTAAHAAGFEPAKNSTKSAQFLQIVAKPKPRKTSEPKLTRVAFKVSRLMEFCSERELQNQTGHSICDWPLVVGKEVVDNAIDACEEAAVAPDITVIVGPGTIIIQDNAGGIDSETIESILDYTIRVSSREAYVSPTRGARREMR
jgi:hypothetical protein